MKQLFLKRGAIEYLIWTLLFTITVTFHYAFNALSVGQEIDNSWGFGVGISAVGTALVLLIPSRVPAKTAPPVGGGQTRNGATAPAFAVACMFAGMAWVWGIFLVYFSMPLVIFCVARWRAEWALRRQEKRAA